MCMPVLACTESTIIIYSSIGNIKSDKTILGKDRIKAIGKGISIYVCVCDNFNVKYVN